ncbi:pyridoxamine 5'-phosphate oxidase family protein [Ruminiclostridium herbifermentans]|uniref:Pyridoxamine 5'-phosphate oxidase family protein n=1 Tax=Ruminiclostridium herbifermentans TaxID=2488810 RepID=A0A4U7JMX9_9FIRM|nr:pyridoxamine 5'-phosphate oxidase family protein [Ruminiclostridium herbifermentans]QNU68595.1 pyridoxamine 5'-phosphate oxidase family protein [Ruminiclostridium herbifermentans]
MDEVVKFLEENPVFYIATVDGDTPKVRPFGFFLKHQQKLYFGVGNQKETFKQLQKNPKFEISTTSKDNTWLRLSGNAVFETSEELLEKAFERNPNLKALYSKENGPRLELFYIENAKAEFLNFLGEHKVINF